MTVLDRSEPLIDTGRGWPRYPSEDPGVQPSWLDVRTDAQREADTWASMQHWRHWTIAWTSTDRDIVQAAQREWDLAQAYLWGLTAPTELHAKRLAWTFLDWERLFMRRQPEAEALDLAVAVLRGYADAHG